MIEIRNLCMGIAAAAVTLASATAAAHVAVSSGPATADATSVVTFGVGHGCTGMDTYALTIDIPPGVTSVRAMRSDFGTPSVVRDIEGNVASVTWQKPDTEVLEEDFGYYEVSVRMRTPDAPFSEVHFVVNQTCRAPDGTLTTVDWSDTPSTPPAEAVGRPAATLALLPALHAGWNKLTIPVDLPDLSVFSKAQIVWRGAAAYSANPTIAELIAGTPTVTVLTNLAEGDEIWVKF